MLSRSGSIALGIAAMTLAVAVPDISTTAREVTNPDLPTALTALLKLALAALAAWVVICTTLGSTRGLPSVIARTLVPAAFFTMAAIGPAAAGSSWPVDGLRLPERTSTAEPSGKNHGSHGKNQRAQPTQRTTATIIVKPGDSLWNIARTQLPDGVSQRQIAGLTEQLHELNRGTIGNDADLLKPGQPLAIGTAEESR